MIRLLRSISVHLWLTVLLSVPAVFGILAFLSPFLPGLDPVAATIVVFLAVVTGMGFLLDFVAQKMVFRLIKEGQAWERSGLESKARKAYQRAIRLYDTFLLIPVLNRRVTYRICGAISRFQVEAGQDYQAFNLAFSRYLKFHPEDEDMVLAWLKQLRIKTAISSLEQEVLTLLADRHYGNPLIQDILADIFLRLERRDFEAKRLYRHVAKDAVKGADYQARIEKLVGKQDTAIPQPDDRETPEKIRVKQKIQFGQLFVGIFKRAKTAVETIIVYTGSALSFIVLSAGRLFTWFKESPRALFYLKSTFLSIVCIWLAFFMISTITHMFKSRAVQKNGQKQLEVQVPKPFTIQVAAYLKQKHADRYVAALRKKDIDAHVKKAAGGGKTWYLVRVSAFVDKKSATEYGMKLKQQKIIEDFFVNNK